ncbi:MAG: cytochrome c3 family protein, partial [bacterium]|nr:cytochrome c3 family protein [bacterium]
MRRLVRIGIPAAAVLVAIAAWAQSDREKLPAPAPEQPIPFSHKLHSGVGIECLDCHPIRGEGFSAGFPKETTCMGCHLVVNKQTPAIRTLARYVKQKKPIPWVRIYEVPQYVWFSH